MRFIRPRSVYTVARVRGGLGWGLVQTSEVIFLRLLTSGRRPLARLPRVSYPSIELDSEYSPSGQPRLAETQTVAGD